MCYVSKVSPLALIIHEVYVMCLILEVLKLYIQAYLRNMATSSSTRTPKDAQVIISMLSEAGITDYEPRVVNQMLEFTYSKLNFPQIY